MDLNPFLSFFRFLVFLLSLLNFDRKLAVCFLLTTMISGDWLLVYSYSILLANKISCTCHFFNVIFIFVMISICRLWGKSLYLRWVKRFKTFEQSFLGIYCFIKNWVFPLLTVVRCYLCIYLAFIMFYCCVCNFVSSVYAYLICILRLYFYFLMQPA